MPVAFGIAILLGVALLTPIINEVFGGEGYANFQNYSDTYPLLDWGTITAIATATIALFAIFQYGESRRSSQRGLRAYVSSLPSRAALKYGDSEIVIIVETENTGRTPAFKTQVLWDVSVMEYPLTQTLVYHGHVEDIGKPVPTFVTYPGAKHMGIKSFELTAEILRQLRANTHALYAYGRVTYVDAFNDFQSGDFCAYIDGESLDVWLKDASASENRKPIAAPFKFTQNNNTASFS
jgi:hypothetical protein